MSPMDEFIMPWKRRPLVAEMSPAPVRFICFSYFLYYAFAIRQRVLAKELCFPSAAFVRTDLVTTISHERLQQYRSNLPGIFISPQLTQPSTLSGTVKWVLAKRRWCTAAGKVTAGLAESNGSLPPDGWLIVTCGLTACTPGSTPGPSLGNESMGILYLFTHTDDLIRF